MGNVSPVRIITAIGGNLFQIAATQLGSAMQWVNIAQANGITDPNLSGPTELAIPALSAAFTNGVSPQ
ncbi:MAG TPA: hypothetical protein DDZ81_07895 [Acetobacteraceae bacterium]|jgi:hypothetical protein|nr:hypothetical protein [Acetobacteraceae bacterium]